MANSKPKIKVDWSQYTDLQKKAMAGYVRHGNKYKAYKEAYDCEGSSEKTSKRNCYKFFAKPEIKAVVDQIREEAIKFANVEIEDAANAFTEQLIKDAEEEQLLKVDAAWVLRRAVMLADFNIRKFIKTDKHGNATYDFSEATDDDWYCIQEYTVEEIERGSQEDKYSVDRIKIKLPDKLAALKLVGQHVEIQAFRENVGIGGLDGGAIETADVTDEVLKQKMIDLGLGGKGSQLDDKLSKS